MKHEILAADGIRVDLENRILTRYAALQRVIQATMDTRGGYTLSEQFAAAEALSDALRCQLGGAESGWAEAMGRNAAELIVADLTEVTERNTSAFWSSPLGRACGWWLGGPGEATAGVSLAIAGAIIGMSRQGIHEARGKGKFANVPGGVTAASVRAWMHRTYPLVTS